MTLLIVVVDEKSLSFFDCLVCCLPYLPLLKSIHEIHLHLSTCLFQKIVVGTHLRSCSSRYIGHHGQSIVQSFLNFTFELQVTHEAW
jgi:hypothetical protein